jgi:hypothetical protein
MQSNFRVAGWHGAAIGSSQAPLRQAQGRLSRKRREKWGTHFNVSVDFKIKANIKINVKGSGQECPLHTGWAAEAAVYFLWA